MAKDIRIMVEVAGQKYELRYPTPVDQSEIDEAMPEVTKAIRELFESELIGN